VREPRIHDPRVADRDPTQTMAPVPARGRHSVIVLGAGITAAVLAIVAMVVVAFTGLGRDGGEPVANGSPTGEPNVANVPGESASDSASPTGEVSTTAGPVVGSGGVPAGWPNASNTGVPVGRPLQQSGSVRVTRAGTVIDGLEVNGDISVEAPNVTIRNTRIVNNGEWGIIQRDQAGGLVVEDVEIRGNGADQLGKGIYNIGGMLTVRRTNISVVTDGIMTSVGLIEDNYLHDPKEYSGDHVDMVQSGSAPPAGLSLVIRHNTIVNTRDQTSAVALFQDFGIQRDVTVENNFLAGGGYTLYAGAGEKGTATNIKIVNNVWSRQIFAKGGYFGPVAYWDRDGSGNVWTGNRWADTGAAINP
jgi:hypothetical protein